MFWSFECALDKRFVDDHLRGDVCQLFSLPGFHLLSNWLKVSLHPVNAAGAILGRFSNIAAVAPYKCGGQGLCSLEMIITRSVQIRIIKMLGVLVYPECFQVRLKYGHGTASGPLPRWSVKVCKFEL